MCGAVQLLAGDLVKIDSAVASGPKTNLGVHFQPNPLVVMHEYDRVWLFWGRRGNLWPPVGRITTTAAPALNSKAALVLPIPAYPTAKETTVCTVAG